MSSIRSLAMITVLAGVGVFLYMKINETEPVLPDEVAGFQFNESLEFDSGFEATPSFSIESGSPESPAAGGSAPTFSATPSAPVGETAPAFNVTPTTTPSAPAASAAPPFVASPATDASALNTTPTGIAMPDLPTLPPATTPTIPAVVESTPQPPVTAEGQASLFSATHVAVEAALDRGQLSQALQLLSDWYGDPSLSLGETQEVDRLLSQLAGSVIYSTEHRLEPPYMVKSGEQLQDIAARYAVPWQLLAKINGITQSDQLRVGQQLKVLRGPFSATIDLSQRRITLMLNRRYAGQFSIEVDPTTTVEEGHWSVNQKLLTPGNVNQFSSSPVTPTEDRSLVLSNSTGGTNQLVIIRGANASIAADPAGRVIRLSSADVSDVYDILSLGSQVVIRR